MGWVRAEYEVGRGLGRDGSFTVSVTAAVNGAKLGEDRQLLVCESGDREMADLRAKPELMGELARISGGKTFALSANAPEVTQAFSSPPPATVEYRHNPLSDTWWWLGLVLLLLTIEWSVRRLTGIA